MEEKDKKFSKEKSILKFCKERGWNIDELTTGQMLFIIKQLNSKKTK
jgi:hypothetical protein